MNFSIIFKISIIFWCLTLGFTDWRLQWNEEFKGNEIDQTRWRIVNEEYCQSDNLNRILFLFLIEILYFFQAIIGMRLIAIRITREIFDKLMELSP